MVKKITDRINSKAELSKEGNIYDFIREINSDEKILSFLEKKIKKDRGLLVGKKEYFDDIRVEVLYGLAFDFRYKSHPLELFSFVAYPMLRTSKYVPTKQNDSFHLGTLFSFNFPEGYCKEPSKEEFLKGLEWAINNYPKGRINLNKEYL